MKAAAANTIPKILYPITPEAARNEEAAMLSGSICAFVIFVTHRIARNSKILTISATPIPSDADFVT